MVKGLLHEIISHWQHWLISMVIAVLMALTVLLIAEGISGHAHNSDLIRGEVQALERRITSIETSQHPATTKRYTSDMAAADKALTLGELARLDAAIAAHLKQESDERAAHDWKCRQRWAEVARLQVEVAALKSILHPPAPPQP